MGSALPTGSFIFTGETYLLWTGKSFLFCGKQRLLKYQEEGSHVVITHLRNNRLRYSLKLSVLLKDTSVSKHSYEMQLQSNAIYLFARSETIILQKFPEV